MTLAPLENVDIFRFAGVSVSSVKFFYNKKYDILTGTGEGGGFVLKTSSFWILNFEIVYVETFKEIQCWARASLV